MSVDSPLGRHHEAQRCKENLELTSGNYVVDNENFLSLLDSILLHLELVCAIFLDILGRDTWTRQFALLSNGSKSDSKTQRQAGTKEEATSIESNNDVRHGIGKGMSNLHFEGRDERGVGAGIGEQGHDINEFDAWDWEVGKLTKMTAQIHLGTGELGGGGGGGGGLSSRGIILGS